LFTIFVDNRFVARRLDDLPTVSDVTASCDSNVTFGKIKNVDDADDKNGPV
jgi:hypothetical protein